MPEPTPVMHVQENRRTGQRGDVWSVSIEGENDESTGSAGSAGSAGSVGSSGSAGSAGSVGSVGSWKQAQELAASKNAILEPPSPGLRREMVEAGIPREEFGESSAAALFSHPHGVPDI
jgi:hypothetical protein